MSRIPAPKVQKKTSKQVYPNPRPSVVGTRTSIVSQRGPTGGRQVARITPSDDKLEGPSNLQKRVFKQALSKSAKEPGKKTSSVGMTQAKVRQPTVMTKRGREPVVQQMKTQTTIQRTPKGEYIGKSVVGVDVDAQGQAQQIEMTEQQIDPRYATESEGVNETISATSSLSVTTGGKQIKKSYKKSTVIADKFKSKPNLNPHHLDRLVKEETEDVENTLKMVPPDLISTSLEKFPLKRKLQKLRLNAEPMALLTESVIYPTPTADEVDAEAPPEVLAEVMDAVEKGATPEAAPTQLFNSLFPEVEEPRIDVSSVAPGLLEDVVVPIGQPPRLVDQVLTQEMEDFLVNQVQNAQQLPKDSLCVDNNVAAVPLAAGEIKDPLNVETEAAPWEDATVQKLSDLVGAYPMNLLETSDFSTINSADISGELSKGIDYFLDADAVPYQTKIQIRGSKLPKWFPGYMSAFPHLPEIVKISKSPSEVLHTAWKAVQPKIFPEESLLIA